jgi:hypothetical protein
MGHTLLWPMRDACIETGRGGRRVAAGRGQQSQSKSLPCSQPRGNVNAGVVRAELETIHATSSSSLARLLRFVSLAPPTSHHYMRDSFTAERMSILQCPSGAVWVFPLPRFSFVFFSPWMSLIIRVAYSTAPRISSWFVYPLQSITSEFTTA